MRDPRGEIGERFEAKTTTRTKKISDVGTTERGCSIGDWERGRGVGKATPGSPINRTTDPEADQGGRRIRYKALAAISTEKRVVRHNPVTDAPAAGFARGDQMAHDQDAICCTEKDAMLRRGRSISSPVKAKQSLRGFRVIGQPHAAFRGDELRAMTFRRWARRGDVQCHEHIDRAIAWFPERRMPRVG